ncbi:MAG: helix-turn-helix transcriptional regulator [Clostridia bacterium]|nr:helix-turn-helix transcriptional regulator [Clostridia bacterium]
MNEIEIFCNNVRLLRRTFHLSEKEMAKKMGISVGSLTKLESGVLPSRLTHEVLIYIYHNFTITPQRMFSPLSETDLADL